MMTHLVGQEEDPQTLQAFEVYSTAQENSVERRRQSDTIGSFLSSDTLGELPDDDLGEALSRLAGVNVIGGQGLDEGNVVIRGADGQYNSIRVNGAAQANARLGSRLYDVSQIPAEMVASVEVLKTITAEHPADSIGGAVNVETATAFTTGERIGRYKVEGRFRDQADEWGYGANFIYSDVYSLGGGEDNFGMFLNFNWVDERLVAWGSQMRYMSNPNRLRGSDAENAVIANTSILEVNPDATIPLWERFDPNEQRADRNELTFNASFDLRVGEATKLYFRPWYQKSESEVNQHDFRIDRVERAFGNNFWFLDEAGDAIGQFEDTDNDGVLGGENDVFVRGTDGSGDIIVTPNFEASFDGRHYRALRNRLDESETYTLDLGGETELENGKLDYRVLLSVDEGTRFDRDWRFQEEFRDARSGDPLRIRVTDGSTPLPEFSLFEVTEGRGHVPSNNRENVFNDGNRIFTNVGPLFKFDDIKEEVLLGSINYEHDFSEKFTVKSGVRYRKSTRENLVTQLFFNPEAGSGRVLPIAQIAEAQGPNTLFGGKYTEAFGPFYNVLPAYDYFNANPGEFEFNRTDLRDAADTADLEEAIFGAYVQGTYRWKNLTVVGGLRYEKTDLDTSWRASNFFVDARNLPGLTTAERDAMNGLVQDTVGDIGFTGPAGGFNFGDVVDDLNASSDYDNWMPSLVASYRAGDRHIFRLAWTNTLTRPDFRELIPFDGGAVNQQLADAGVINLTNRDEEFDIGNPNLTEQTAENLDFAWEYYFGKNRRNTLSVTLFRKELEDFLQEDTFVRDVEVLIDPTDPSQGTEFVRGDTNFWTNAAGRTIEGIELSGYFSIEDLFPSWTWLHGLGVTPNYTYITGNQEDPIFDLDELAQGNVVVIGTEESGNLTNQPEHIVNLQFFYQLQRLNVRLSYNYISEIQQNPSTAAITAATFNGEQSFWDLSIQYQLFQEQDLRLFLEVDNLTNQEDDLEYIGPREALYVTGYEEIGRRFVFGLRGSF